MADPENEPQPGQTRSRETASGSEASPAREKAEELADDLGVDDPQERERLIARVTSVSMSSAVPFPGIVAGYEKAVEGGGKWLLQYTRDEQEHRHAMDRRQAVYRIAGQIFAFVLGLVGIGGGLLLASTGVEWFGFAAFFSTLVTLVGLFLYNKKVRAKNEERGDV